MVETFIDRDSCNLTNNADTDSITNAITAAQENDVIVSPITAFLLDLFNDPTGQTGQFHPCVVDEGQRIADATGGTRFEIGQIPAQDMAEVLFTLVQDACEEVVGGQTAAAAQEDDDMNDDD